MEATLTFPNVSFAQSDGQGVRVKLGEVFTMKLSGAPQGLQWTTSKDPVLQVDEQDANTAKVTALKKGAARILLLNEGDSAVYRLSFDVYDPEEAAAFVVPPGKTEPIQA